MKKRSFRFRTSSSFSLYPSQGGRNFFWLGLKRCDIAVPGNRECAVQSRWLLRGKQITMLVMVVNGGRIEVLRIHGICLIKASSLGFFLCGENDYFLALGLVGFITRKSFGRQTHSKFRMIS